MVFLYKCLANNVTPKSFRLCAPIKTTKCENIMKELRRKLLTHARNEAKRRLHESKNRIMNICSTLCQVLSPEDYKNIMRVTDTSKDTEYQKSKRHLKEKFQQLKNENQKHSQIVLKNTRKNTRAVLNLTGKTVDKNVTSLLNLGPNFVPTPKSIPHMEIITSIESQALKLESSKKDRSAENLRQTVSKILSKTIGMKQQDNLSKVQRAALKQLKNDKKMKVYPFDKGIGFALLNDIDSISKIEEQLGKSKIIDCDPTNLLTEKFQTHLQKLKKEGKFDKKTHSLIYPSDCIPHRLYGTLKAYKPEKNYPMRAVVSTIGSPVYGTLKYLAKIIQRTLNKNKHRVLNSSSFVEKAKEWNISSSEIQTSFNVVNLYSSVPLDETVAVIIEILDNDIDDL